MLIRQCAQVTRPNCATVYFRLLRPAARAGSQQAEGLFISRFASANQEPVLAFDRR